MEVFYFLIATLVGVSATFILGKYSDNNNGYENEFSSLAWCVCFGVIIGVVWPVSIAVTLLYGVAWLGHKFA